MLEIEFKSKELKKYLLRVLGKKEKDIITDEDVKKIKSLRISSELVQDGSFGNLVFFNNLETLTLDGININDTNIKLLERLKNIKNIVITNAVIELEDEKYLNENLENIIFVNCRNVDAKKFNENEKLARLSIISCEDIQLEGISELENLEEVNLPNNEELGDRDIQDIWNIKKLRAVNFDGDPNISVHKYTNIQISHDEQYRPTEKERWEEKTSESINYSLSYLLGLSEEEIDRLQGIEVNIRKEDLSILESQEGKNLIQRLKNNNRISLSFNNTAEMDINTLERLNEMCNFTRVYVQTGWKGTQNKGYSYDTYKQIKQEIIKIVESINPNLSEEKKYLKVREMIIENIHYDYSALSTTQNDVDYYASRNLENGLLNQTCLCAGYADILENVLAEVGIKCIYVEGETDKGEAHAWNQVRLKGDDGEYHWYNEDVTWDAINGNYSYCALNDELFSKTHRAILERTEGENVYECFAVPPAAIRKAKSLKNQNMSFTTENIAPEER